MDLTAKNQLQWKASDLDCPLPIPPALCLAACNQRPWLRYVCMQPCATLWQRVSGGRFGSKDKIIDGSSVVKIMNIMTTIVTVRLIVIAIANNKSIDNKNDGVFDRFKKQWQQQE